MPLPAGEDRKEYFPPQLRKLTREQANLVLIGHASCGHRGATELLTVFYPSLEPERKHNVREHPKNNDLTQTVSRTSDAVHRVLTAFQTAREDFRRLVRG